MYFLFLVYSELLKEMYQSTESGIDAKVVFSSLYTIKSDLTTWYERVILVVVYMYLLSGFRSEFSFIYTFFCYAESKIFVSSIRKSIFSCVQKSGVKC